MNRYDHHETYCRSLGDCIHFSYCRAAGGTEPCTKILDCWFGRLPILEFVQQQFAPEVLERITAPQPGRLQKLKDIAEKTLRDRKS